MPLSGMAAYRCAGATMTNADGAYRVESKSGHRTIRIAIQDPAYAHEQHEGLRDGLEQIGVLTEFRGHRCWCRRR
jgi:hypothetical protein